MCLIIVTTYVSLKDVFVSFCLSILSFFNLTDFMPTFHIKKCLNINTIFLLYAYRTVPILIVYKCILLFLSLILCFALYNSNNDLNVLF